MVLFLSPVTITSLGISPLVFPQRVSHYKGKEENNHFCSFCDQYKTATKDLPGFRKFELENRLNAKVLVS